MDAEDVNHDIFDPLMTAYLAQTTSAMDISKLVSEHGNEQELSADSVITGLIYRLMVPMKDSDMERSLQSAKEIMECQSESDDDGFDFGDCEVDDDIKTEDHNDKVIVNRKVKRNSCNCDICIQCRVCLDNYNSFELYGDKLAQIFKDSIDNACQIHNISI